LVADVERGGRFVEEHDRGLERRACATTAR
jgi:hypothetical protein